MTLPSRDDVLAWMGLPVHDSAGAVCGSCRNVYTDQDSGLPEWVEVQLGSGDTALAPVLGARFEAGVVHLAHALDVVDRSPRSTPDVDRTPEEERALYEHYGVAWSDARSSTLLPAAVDDTTTVDAGATDASATGTTSRSGDEPVRPALHAVDPPSAAASTTRRAAPVVAVAAALGVAALLRRRRRQPEATALGAAVLLAPVALVAAVVGRRRARANVDVGVAATAAGVAPMTPVVDHRTPAEVDART